MQLFKHFAMLLAAACGLPHCLSRQRSPGYATRCPLRGFLLGEEQVPAAASTARLALGGDGVPWTLFLCAAASPLLVAVFLYAIGCREPEANEHTTKPVVNQQHASPAAVNPFISLRRLWPKRRAVERQQDRHSCAPPVHGTSVLRFPQWLQRLTFTTRKPSASFEAPQAHMNTSPRASTCYENTTGFGYQPRKQYPGVRVPAVITECEQRIDRILKQTEKLLAVLPPVRARPHQHRVSQETPQVTTPSSAYYRRTSASPTPDGDERVAHAHFLPSHVNAGKGSEPVESLSVQSRKPHTTVPCESFSRQPTPPGIGNPDNTASTIRQQVQSNAHRASDDSVPLTGGTPTHAENRNNEGSRPDDDFVAAARAFEREVFSDDDLTAGRQMTDPLAPEPVNAVHQENPATFSSHRCSIVDGAEQIESWSTTTTTTTKHTTLRRASSPLPTSTSPQHAESDVLPVFPPYSVPNSPVQLSLNGGG